MGRCPYVQNYTEGNLAFGIDSLLPPNQWPVFDSVYPLHDSSLLDDATGVRYDLSKDWGSIRFEIWGKKQPLNKIRKYFGEKIAIGEIEKIKNAVLLIFWTFSGFFFEFFCIFKYPGILLMCHAEHVERLVEIFRSNVGKIYISYDVAVWNFALREPEEFHGGISVLNYY